MTIGDRIKEAREKINMTQEDLAKYIASGKQTIYKYENNIVTNIPSDKVEKLAAALLVKPGELMGWTCCDPMDHDGKEDVLTLLDALNESGLSKVKEYINDLSINVIYKK